MMHKAVKLYSDQGLNVIVDEIFMDNGKQEYKKLFYDCIELLHDYPVFFVRLDCPIEELKKRELERGDREIGDAEWQFPIITPKDIYDIRVDTHKNTLEVCAKEIIEILGKPNEMSAFKCIYQKLLE